jgi:branched-chain amino acid transport system substrate-binding protein
MRRAVAWAAALAFAMLPCAGRAAEPYEIHVILSLTGPLTFIGQAQRDGLVALEDVVNRDGGIGGRPVRFVLHDDQTNPQVAIELFDQILASNPPAVLGPTSSASCNAIFPLVKRGPLVYCFSIAATAHAGSFEFGALATNYDQNLAGIRYLRARGLTRLAFIAPTDATGADSERAVDAILALPENRGMTLVAREHFTSSDAGVAAQIVHIKASGASAILVGTASTAAVTVFHGLGDAGLDLPVVAGYGIASVAYLRQFAPYLPRELLIEGFPCLAPNAMLDGPSRKAYQAYRAAMAARAVNVVDCLPASAWDPAAILIAALRKLGTGATAERVRLYIEGLTNFPGADGTFDFKRVPQRGMDDRAIVITRWDPAKPAFVAVSKSGGAPL